jgi:hypothetical protein
MGRPDPFAREYSPPVSEFELEEFERSGDRLRVAGRWSDVRGMRFMRPSLTVGGRRILAVLDHKPWAPEEGKRWVAEFLWDGDPDDVDLELAELAVAPSVAVLLAGPGVPVQAKQPAPDPRVAEDERRRRSQAEISFLREQIDLLTARLAETERERDEARAQAEDERGVARELDAERGQVDAARAELDAARAQRDASMRELDTERERLAAAQAALDPARAERDAAVRELAAVRAEIAATPAPEPPVQTEAPLGVVAPHAARNPAPHAFGALDLWAPRIALGVFAVCVLALLVGLLKIL